MSTSRPTLSPLVVGWLVQHIPEHNNCDSQDTPRYRGFASPLALPPRVPDRPLVETPRPGGAGTREGRTSGVLSFEVCFEVVEGFSIKDVSVVLERLAQ
jgi:hypothetical protein